ncbi:putative lipid II flippase MurJ [Frankliniella fusca]|uniref:Lipid II flippase MurJ n=1 Tax=Frankliniella fusca TaxID=407009 RepID=A0AAE1GYN4_9NEOP|nr:putative lipid II flippase MurJ [Frankliniella fusca]
MFGFHSNRLTGLELLNFKEKHKGTRFIFVDEYSMIVFDKPLYCEIENLPRYNHLLERGKVVMTQLTSAVVLTKCHRFANEDYLTFLKKVANGRCT